jgi:hypothetical protein
LCKWVPRVWYPAEICLGGLIFCWPEWSWTCRITSKSFSVVSKSCINR